MWAAHTDKDGAITGWEERGPNWRGFASGGAKVLFRLGRPDALRLAKAAAQVHLTAIAYNLKRTLTILQTASA